MKQLMFSLNAESANNFAALSHFPFDFHVNYLNNSISMTIEVLVQQNKKVSSSALDFQRLIEAKNTKRLRCFYFFDENISIEEVARGSKAKSKQNVACGI